MGLKLPHIPDDYAPGNDCTRCHPPGQTPNYVFVRFTGITPCGANPPPPNGVTIICEQDPIDNCFWYGELDYGGHIWQCYYFASDFRLPEWFSALQLSCLTTPDPLFFAEKSAECAELFEESYTVCPGNAGTGGKGKVDVINPLLIIALTSCYHLVTQRPVLYEVQEVGIDHKLVHLASKFDKTNVLIYIDTQDVDLSGH